MAGQRLLTLLFLTVILQHVTIHCFSSTRQLRRPLRHTLSATDDDGSCPFSKNFPKYRIDFTRVEAKEKPGFNLMGGLQKTFGKGKMDKKFQNTVEWLEEDAASISVFTKLWDAAHQLSTGSKPGEDRIVIGLTDSALVGVAQRWCDILEWMQSEKALDPLRNNMILDATIHKDGDVLAVDLTRRGHPRVTEARVGFNPAALDKRTQAWVQRILVEQGICPFTKSVKVSGQGLDDLGIPVAKIHYCASDASPNQLFKLMADAWTEIAYMLEMGPSGRKGISSILLAAPFFDEDFDLWSGPVFAVLESGVVACGLENQVGVVCFHPRYMTPDGRSFPGFGHMHSVPRLKKWLKEQDESLQERLSDDEIAAGGAWQRRTPHATINVLRAEQLQAAEGRRITGELYSENIRKLVGKPNGLGIDKLMDDLEKERSLR